MKKNHFLFLKQLAIGLVSFILFSMTSVILFNGDFESPSYVRKFKRINDLRKSSTEILKNLIETNEVTFDPTNGTSIELVLNNLKRTKKKKVLLLGSSQLVTLNDDWSYDNYLNRVDKVLESYYYENAVVYNLSMGGMTVAEKKILLDKTLEIITFDIIVLSIGPYDCIKSDVRAGLGSIISKNLEIERGETIKNSAKEDRMFSILDLNSKIENDIQNGFSYWFPFFEKKGAIKLMVKDRFNQILKTPYIHKPLKKPKSWRTFNQELDDISGWVANVSYSKERSLKIYKVDSLTNASWKGFKVNFEPTNSIVLGGWSKSDNVVGSNLYGLDFEINFIDGTSKWYYKGLEFDDGTHDWQSREIKLNFGKSIISITPQLLLYKGTGTVWFDNIYANPIYNKIGKNVISNYDLEEESNRKDVYTLKFEENVWGDIFNNSNAMATYLKEKLPERSKPYILIPPAYTSKIKNAYEQDYLFDKYVSLLSETCMNSKITLLNANELLGESHFIEFEAGDKKGLVEPLHFDTKGHEKLAKYLRTQINLD